MLRDNPDADATLVLPPRPNSRATAPATTRRCNSFKCGITAENNRSSSSTGASTPQAYIARLILWWTHSLARAAADELLERFRLADRKTAHIAALSGGMARRLMVARALLHRPAVIFLDEPTAGLDPQSRIALWEVLTQLQSEGQTVLVTTHRMEEADEQCDRVAIMDHGRILAVDTPRRLKASFGTGASVVARTDERLEDLAIHLQRTLDASGCRMIDGEIRFNLAQPDGALQRVVAAALAGGFDLTDVSISSDTLESVFVHLTGKELRE